MHLVNSPFEGFDWSLLDRADFGEAAVREVLITPLLWTLGYKESAPNRIVRETKLEHPFVALGTTQHKISLIPDYLLTAQNRPAWILDAKSPKESVIDVAHEAQAYSYACHRDVRCDWYAVCNGREFAAFNVRDMRIEPRMRFPLSRLPEAFAELWSSLAPEMVHKGSGAYLKDFGIHLLKLGVPSEARLDFLGVEISTIGRVDDSLFTIPGAVNVEGRQYFASLDFGRERLEELLPLLPRGIADAARNLTEVPSILKIQHTQPIVGVSVRQTTGILENDKEHYLPLEVVEFRSM